MSKKCASLIIWLDVCISAILDKWNLNINFPSKAYTIFPLFDIFFSEFYQHQYLINMFEHHLISFSLSLLSEIPVSNFH